MNNNNPDHHQHVSVTETGTFSSYFGKTFGSGMARFALVGVILLIPTVLCGGFCLFSFVIALLAPKEVASVENVNKSNSPNGTINTSKSEGQVKPSNSAVVESKPKDNPSPVSLIDNNYDIKFVMIDGYDKENTKVLVNGKSISNGLCNALT